MQTLSIAIRVENHPNLGEEEKGILQQKFSGHILPQSSAEPLIRKLGATLHFVLTVNRNSVKTLMASDWEIVLVGNSLIDMFNESIRITKEINDAFNVRVHMVGTGRVEWLGYRIGRQDALINLGISLGAAFVTPVISLVSQPEKLPSFETLIIDYFILAATFFGIGTVMIYYLIRR